MSSQQGTTTKTTKVQVKLIQTSPPPDPGNNKRKRGPYKKDPDKQREARERRKAYIRDYHARSAELRRACETLAGCKGPTEFCDCLRLLLRMLEVPPDVRVDIRRTTE